MLSLSVWASSANGQAQEPPDADTLRQEVMVTVASMAKRSQVMVDTVFSFGELGFQEFETAKYITGILEEEGFEIVMGCAGMPTCYVASWGTGHPVIGFMGDIDGLPETSQKPGVAYRDPLIPGGPGHGEGHNSAPAVDVIAAIATKRVMEKYGLQGTLKVIPGVAEELLGSRTYMVNANLFDGMDIMLSTHISSGMGTAWGMSGSGMVSTQFTFHGESAHGAADPWRGRSALDAVELMNSGWNFRREHLRLQQRSHYIISNGGSQPNVVPSEASVWYYFRELDYERIKDLHGKGQRIAEGAAMMTDTEVEERIYGARVIAMTAIDLVAAPEKVEEAWTFHREVVTKDTQWQSLIPVDAPPPIHLNADKMERYRPLLKPLYYDAERYDTYMEQLGINYPALETPESADD
ncbi:MAG: amidohydrolase [Pseudomonadota bacterium]